MPIKKTMAWIAGALAAITTAGYGALLANGSNATTFLLNVPSILNLFSKDKKSEPALKVRARTYYSDIYKVTAQGSAEQQTRSATTRINAPPRYANNTTHIITIFIENMKSLTLENVQLLNNGTIQAPNNESYVPVTIIDQVKPLTFTIHQKFDFDNNFSMFIDFLTAKEKKSLRDIMNSSRLDIFGEHVTNDVDYYTWCYKDTSYRNTFIYKRYLHRITEYYMHFSDKTFNRYCISGSVPFSLSDIGVAETLPN